VALALPVIATSAWMMMNDGWDDEDDIEVNIRGFHSCRGT
jgi:hypothetical protein